MATYYVSKTGSDAADGSSGSPWLTILHALSGRVAGDTVYVRPGVYAESLFDAIPTGNASLPFTLSNDPAFVDPITLLPASGFRVLSFGTPVQYITVSGLVLDGSNVTSDCVKITSGANHITIADCEIKNAPSAQGLLISGDGSDFNQILRCIIHDNGNDGLEHQLYLQTSDNLIEGCEIYGGFGYGVHEIAGSCARNIYRRNTIHDILNVGLLLSSGHDNQVYYNLFYNCQLGIQVLGVENNSLIYNNTIYTTLSGSGGIHMEGRVGSPPIYDNVVRNNIAIAQVFGYRDNDSVNTTVDHNLFNIMQPSLAGNLVGIDPLFVALASQNFRLQPGSAAINSGVDVELTQDIVGKFFIGVPDIGAYEFGLAAPTNLRRVSA